MQGGDPSFGPDAMCDSVHLTTDIRYPSNMEFGMIHELIHVDTQGCFKNPDKSLRLPTDSNEITTCLLTNKVVEKLNKKFKLNVQPQSFHSYYAEFIKNYKKALENIGKTERGYKSLVLTVDKFLKNKKYTSYYQDRAFRKLKAEN